MTCGHVLAHSAPLCLRSEDYMFPDPKSDAKMAKKQHTAKPMNKCSRTGRLQTASRQVQLLKGAAPTLCQDEFSPKISALG